jgi:anthrone oxygenase-like protein
MIAGLLALTIAALFSGAAVYITIAEQPARLKLDAPAMLTQWHASYNRAIIMQASLAIVGFLFGLAAWWQSGHLAFLLGAVLLLANWPFMLLRIMPVNRLLMATPAAEADASSRSLIKQWARLHTVRTGLGFAATLSFLWALS